MTRADMEAFFKIEDIQTSPVMVQEEPLRDKDQEKEDKKHRKKHKHKRRRYVLQL